MEGTPVPRAGNEPRQARSRETRSRLLDAAVDCLLDVGYGGTTTSLVLERAGVARGSLLHQFPTRQGLLLEAIRHVVANGMAEMSEIGRSAGERGHGVAQATRLLWGTFSARYFWASTELWAAARTDDVLRAALYPEARELGRMVDDTIAKLYGPVASASPDFAFVRDLLLTSMRGVALTYAFSPRDPETEPMMSSWQRLAAEHLCTWSDAVG
jgi:AcrR family transcriptional regulator